MIIPPFTPLNWLIKETTMILRKASLLALAASLFLAIPASAQDRMPEGNGEKTQIMMPTMNAQRGKNIFVNKGCVSCHAINGIGGHDAPAMDDHINLGQVSLFDFAAKMWNHAPGMLAAQEEAFGEQIYFTGNELADIIAFVHNDESQHSFSEKDLTKTALKMMGHEHGGGKSAPEAHAEDVGHAAPENEGHTELPGAAPHQN